MSPLTLCKTSLILLGLALITQNDVVLVRGDSTLVSSYCEAASGNYSSSGDSFTANLGDVGTAILKDASGGAFFSNVTVGSGVDQAFGLYYCDGAIKASDCSACIETAVQQIQDSCNTKEAIIWYLECTLRYANRDIFSKEEITPYAYLPLNQNVSDMTTFSSVLVTTLTGVVQDAAYNTTGDPAAYSSAQGDITSTESLVAVAQCTPDIVGVDCNDCLATALANMDTCCSDSVGAAVFLPSCQIIYAINYADTNSTSSTPFVGTASSPPSTPASSPPSTPASSPPSTPASSPPSTPTSQGKGKFKNSAGSVMTDKSNVIAVIFTAIGFLLFMSLNL